MVYRRCDLVANLSLLYTEFPMLERPRLAQEDGFALVEAWWPFATASPSPEDIAEFVNVLSDTGVTLTGLNCFAGDMAAGDRGVLGDPGRISDVRASIDVAVVIFEALASPEPVLNTLVGKRIADYPESLQRSTAVMHIKYAADKMQRLRGSVVIEPLSGVDGLLVTDHLDVLKLIEDVRQTYPGHSSLQVLGMLADLYHLAALGFDPLAALSPHTSTIRHIQIADEPGRHEPGTGRMDPLHVAVELSARGYAGRVSLEYIPSSTTREGLAMLDTALAAVPSEVS